MHAPVLLPLQQSPCSICLLLLFGRSPTHLLLRRRRKVKACPSIEGKSVSWAAWVGVPETSKFGWESTSRIYFPNEQVSLLDLEIRLYNAYITFCKNSFSQCTWTFPCLSEVSSVLGCDAFFNRWVLYSCFINLPSLAGSPVVGLPSESPFFYLVLTTCFFLFLVLTSARSPRSLFPPSQLEFFLPSQVAFPIFQVPLSPS